MSMKACIHMLALAVIIAAGTFTTTATLHAQNGFLCNGCDHITIVNSGGCKVEICVSGVLYQCYDVASGTTMKVSCALTTSIQIRDCAGNLHEVTPTCESLPIAPGCCVRACLTRDPDGCPVVSITPSPVLCNC